MGDVDASQIALGTTVLTQASRLLRRVKAGEALTGGDNVRIDCYAVATKWDGDYAFAVADEDIASGAMGWAWIPDDPMQAR